MKKNYTVTLEEDVWQRLEELAREQGLVYQGRLSRSAVIEQLVRGKPAAGDWLVSLLNTVVFSSRDWATDPEDAWIYGIIAGWDEPAMVELQRKFQWQPETLDRLRRLRADFQRDTINTETHS